MPRPSCHDDQPRCDECGNYGEWHDGEQAYLCEMCEPEPAAQEEESEPCEDIDATWFA